MLLPGEACYVDVLSVAAKMWPVLLRVVIVLSRFNVLPKPYIYII